jgi:hypothetical protein
MLDRKVTLPLIGVGLLLAAGLLYGIWQLYQHPMLKSQLIAAFAIC